MRGHGQRDADERHGVHFEVIDPGQNRAVSVLKLTTEGTLEEKISAIIESKRRLMEDVVQADDPRERKVFTPEELIHLLEPV